MRLRTKRLLPLFVAAICLGLLSACGDLPKQYASEAPPKVEWEKHPVTGMDKVKVPADEVKKSAVSGISIKLLPEKEQTARINEMKQQPIIPGKGLGGVTLNTSLLDLLESKTLANPALDKTQEADDTVLIPYPAAGVIVVYKNGLPKNVSELLARKGYEGKLEIEDVGEFSIGMKLKEKFGGVAPLQVPDLMKAAYQKLEKKAAPFDCQEFKLCSVEEIRDPETNAKLGKSVIGWHKFAVVVDNKNDDELLGIILTNRPPEGLVRNPVDLVNGSIQLHKLNPLDGGKERDPDTLGLGTRWDDVESKLGILSPVVKSDGRDSSIKYRDYNSIQMRFVGNALNAVVTDEQKANDVLTLLSLSPKSEPNFSKILLTIGDQRVTRDVSESEFKLKLIPVIENPKDTNVRSMTAGMGFLETSVRPFTTQMTQLISEGYQKKFSDKTVGSRIYGFHGKAANLHLESKVIGFNPATKRGQYTSFEVAMTKSSDGKSKVGRIVDIEVGALDTPIDQLIVPKLLQPIELSSKMTSAEVLFKLNDAGGGKAKLAQGYGKLGTEILGIQLGGIVGFPDGKIKGTLRSSSAYIKPKAKGTEPVFLAGFKDLGLRDAELTVPNAALPKLDTVKTLSSALLDTVISVVDIPVNYSPKQPPEVSYRVYSVSTRNLIGGVTGVCGVKEEVIAPALAPKAKEEKVTEPGIIENVFGKFGFVKERPAMAKEAPKETRPLIIKPGMSTAQVQAVLNRILDIRSQMLRDNPKASLVPCGIRYRHSAEVGSEISKIELPDQGVYFVFDNQELMGIGFSLNQEQFYGSFRQVE